MMLALTVSARVKNSADKISAAPEAMQLVEVFLSPSCLHLLQNRAVRIPWIQELIQCSIESGADRGRECLPEVINSARCLSDVSLIACCNF
jgi:hypothetical protein